MIWPFLDYTPSPELLHAFNIDVKSNLYSLIAYCYPDAATCFYAYRDIAIDHLPILEQLLPYYTPKYTLTDYHLHFPEAFL